MITLNTIRHKTLCIFTPAFKILMTDMLIILYEILQKEQPGLLNLLSQASLKRISGGASIYKLDASL